MEVHEELRPYLFAIAYRMLGSVAEAEDVVQDAFVRYEEAGVEPDSPKAYLATVTTRLAIDELRSARNQREVYPGEWLPEPIVDDDATRHAEMSDTLSLAFLHLLEKLSPVERCERSSTTPTTTSRGSSARARRTAGRFSRAPTATSRRGASGSTSPARSARRWRGGSSPPGRRARRTR
jgi:Sigma-70 region 2